MLVLIAEDDPLVALDLAAIVRAHTAADVLLAGSVRAAARFVEQGPDLALLDIDLGDGQSYGLASVLQAQKIPFFFVSGSEPEQVPPALRRAPFLAKPYTSRDVRRAIDAVCSGVAGRSENPLLQVAGSTPVGGLEGRPDFVGRGRTEQILSDGPRERRREPSPFSAIAVPGASAQ